MSHSAQASITSSMTSNAPAHPQIIGPWILGKTLGRGATGRVLLATHNATGQRAAVKVISKADLQEDEVATRENNSSLPYGIEREIIIMKLLTHPNVLRLYDVWETSKALYLVLEYVEGGELFDLLVERGPLLEPEAIKYFRQIILGTAYCHALGICHRDLKPENLLMDNNFNVKLADFGMAALESNGKLLETSCGLPHYAAPEIVSGLKYHGAASDIWSCGVILFALLTGRLPFDDENIRNLLLKVQAGSFEMPQELSVDAQNLLGKMLTVDPTRRITTDKILAHQLLLKYPIPSDDLISVKSLPHPETAYKSLGNQRNIDQQILNNLSILWHDRPKQDIVRCLLVNGPNPEKTFYALLMRYRHDQGESEYDKTGLKKLTSFNSKHGGTSRNGSISTRNTPRRNGGMNVSRPTSFQYKNGAIKAGNKKNSIVLSTQSSPRKSPRRSPRKSPRVMSLTFEEVPPAVPKNLYEEMLKAQGQSEQSMPPSLPSKGEELDQQIGNASALGSQNDVFLTGPPFMGHDSAQDLTAVLPMKSNKRSSMIKLRALDRGSKRMSIRQSMLAGIKRNSITMKLLSTYAKLSNENEWEYIDKQAKRTSATFATLCDKIFNQDDYDVKDELMEDEEDKRAKEYEQLMEIERKKHDAELRARRELDLKKKRQKRKSLMSSKKLSILVKQDESNNSENEGETEAAITQSKLRGKNSGRSASEGTKSSDKDRIGQGLEHSKVRAVTQPVSRSKQALITRRPKSRLDPLWTAYEVQEKDNDYDEFTPLDAPDHKSLREHTSKRKNRESMISILDESKWKGSDDPTPTHEQSTNKPKEKKSETRKSLNLETVEVAKPRYRQPSSLIGDVNIPKVTRKSRNFTDSNKRLSILSLYSTRDSYRDLHSIVGEEDAEAEAKFDTELPGIRTSFADRLARMAKSSDQEDESDGQGEEGSILDFDEHLKNKRTSYYDLGKRNPTVVRKSVSRRPKSKLPLLPSEGSDEGIHGSNGESLGRKFNDSLEEANVENVFDNIKLPEAKSSDSSVGDVKPYSKTKSMIPSARLMLIPEPSAEPQPIQTHTKVRKPQHLPTNIPQPPPQIDKQQFFEDSQKKTKDRRSPSKSFFRKLSWGTKKLLDQPTNDEDLPVEKQSFFSRLFSSSSHPVEQIQLQYSRFSTILPKHEMSTALYSLLKSWSNFGLRELQHDYTSYTISGTVSAHNKFNLKGCKFRISVQGRENEQKSEIICSKVRGSVVTAETLFKEIKKVLHKEQVLDN